MTDEYLQSLRKHLKGIPLEQQEGLIEEIRSHIESGEEDPKQGKDLEQRRRKMLNELGSPKDMGSNLKRIYRSGSLIDYLWVVIPYLFYPFLNALYINLLPKYSWADVRLDIILHLTLVAIGLWRRSAPLTLFWITILVNQLLFITLQSGGFYGAQILVWAVLLLGLLALAGSLIWKHHNDLLLVVFGLMPLLMCILGNVLSALNLTDYSLGPVGRSLVILYSYVNSMAFYGLMAVMAVFFLPANRQLRWLGLLLYGILIGLNHEYFNNVFAGWVYSLWLILPVSIVLAGWLLEQIRKPKLEVAAV